MERILKISFDEFLNLSKREKENLELLNLDENEISSIGVDSFKDLTKLKTLYLSRNKISSIGDDSFKDLKTLKRLYLSRNKIISINSGLENGLENLELLNLDGNEISSIGDDSFKNLKTLKELYLSSNKIISINSGLFNGLENLELLNIYGNEISSIGVDSFKDLTTLKELYLSINKISSIGVDSFKDLKTLKRLDLKFNKITSINSGLFNGLEDLEILYLSVNLISSIGDDSFKNLKKLKQLYLHPIQCNVNSSLFSKLTLEFLTLFDQKSLINPYFLRDNIVIDHKNLLAISIKEHKNIEIGSTSTLNRDSLISIQLNKKWKSIQEQFSWEKIPFKFCALIGLNGTGKTTVLNLIKESLNNYDSQICVLKYFNSAEDKLTIDQNEYEDLNQKILFFQFKSKDEFANLIYDSISDFSLLQYFDYLLLIYSVDSIEQYQSNQIIERIQSNQIIYRFSIERMAERQKQQTDFMNGTSKLTYYKKDVDKKFTSIEYYLLNVDYNTHKLSPGESLILLIELWKFHSIKLKEDNDIKKLPITNKLRILLLDEPDAHMHPKLVKVFINLIRGNQLEYLNLQVIMTTHSPITISFIPKDLIYELKRDEKGISINKIENKSQILQFVSDDLFFIKEKFKIVLVEGEPGKSQMSDDEAFYNFIFYKSTENGTKRKLPIRFQPMGGKMFSQIFDKTETEKEKEFYTQVDPSAPFEDNINDFIYGINDGDYNIEEAYGHFGLPDKSNPPNSEFTDNFKRLKRYNIENYIYDPINLYFAINYLLNKYGLNIEKRKDDSYYNEVVDFIETIKNFKNIKQYLERDKVNNTIKLNEILKSTNEFYIEKMGLNNVIQTDESKDATTKEIKNLITSFENILKKSDFYKNSKNQNKIKSSLDKCSNEFQKNNNNNKQPEIMQFELDSKDQLECLSKPNPIKKPIPIKFKIMSNPNSIEETQIDFSVELNYYPILIYFNGKNLYDKYLKDLISSLNIYKTPNIKDIFGNEGSDPLYHKDPLYYYYALKRYIIKYEEERDRDQKDDIGEINLKQLNNFINKKIYSENDEAIKSANELVKKCLTFKSFQETAENKLIEKILVQTDKFLKNSKKSIQINIPNEDKYELGEKKFPFQHSNIFNLEQEEIDKIYFVDFKFRNEINKKLLIKTFYESGFLLDEHFEIMMNEINGTNDTVLLPLF